MVVGVAPRGVGGADAACLDAEENGTNRMQDRVRRAGIVAAPRRQLMVRLIGAASRADTKQRQRNRIDLRPPTFGRDDLVARGEVLADAAPAETAQSLPGEILAAQLEAIGDWEHHVTRERA